MASLSSPVTKGERGDTDLWLGDPSSGLRPIPEPLRHEGMIAPLYSPLLPGLLIQSPEGLCESLVPSRTSYQSTQTHLDLKLKLSRKPEQPGFPKPCSAERSRSLNTFVFLTGAVLKAEQGLLLLAKIFQKLILSSQPVLTMGLQLVLQPNQWGCKDRGCRGGRREEHLEL